MNPPPDPIARWRRLLGLTRGGLALALAAAGAWAIGPVDVPEVKSPTIEAPDADSSVVSDGNASSFDARAFAVALWREPPQPEPEQIEVPDPEPKPGRELRRLTERFTLIAIVRPASGPPRAAFYDAQQDTLRLVAAGEALTDAAEIRAIEPTRVVVAAAQGPGPTITFDFAPATRSLAEHSGRQRP